MFSQWIYNTFCSIFGTTMIKNTRDFMKIVLDALTAIMTQENFNQWYGIFAAVAASLLIIYFYIDLSGQATRDMLSLERLILAFIKLFLAFAVVVALPHILTYIAQFGKALFDTMSNNSAFGDSASTDNTITIFGSPLSSPPSWGKVEDQFNSDIWKAGIRNTIKQLPIVMQLIIPYGVSWISMLIAFYFALSTSVQMIVYGIFAPIAVVQLFEDGTRSAGIRYLKRFASCALTFAVILGILYAISLLQGSVLAQSLTGFAKSKGITDPATGAIAIDSAEKLKMILTSPKSMLITILATVIQFAAIGAMSQANRIAGDIVGV